MHKDIKQSCESRKLLSGNAFEIDEPLPDPYRYLRFAFYMAVIITMVYLLTSCSYGATLDTWADNIKITEGSPTYGIKLYDKYGESRHICPFKARIICKRTVMHKFREFVAIGHSPADMKGFIFWLADRYCPKSDDYIGNIRWKHNMMVLMNCALTQ